MLDAVAGRGARRQGAAARTRFCMGAAWREPKDRDLDAVCDMVEGVKALGLETCATLGMLTGEQAERLKAAGLDYYNHNLDTSPEFTAKSSPPALIRTGSTRSAMCARRGIKLCCGGIVGMGESRADRVGMIAALGYVCPSIPKACRSTCWCGSRARPWPKPRRSTGSNSCAPSRWRASACRLRWCGCRRGARA